jgi:hypothetical protein
VTAAVLVLLVGLAAPAPASGEPALHLARGSVSRQQLVAVGRDLVIDGEALADVAALDGSVRISGRVAGDVIVLGGGAALLPGARVVGDVFVLGGRIDAAAGAAIGGRAVSYPTVGAAWLTLLEGPSLGLGATSPLVVGGKLALLAAWSLLVLVFFATSGREVLVTADAVRREPLRCFVVGLTGVVTLTLTALFFSAFAAALVGVPLLVLVVVLALVLKLWGMVAVFHALGAWTGGRLGRRPTPLAAATWGLALLGVVKLLPWAGTLAWTAATLIGVGAALSTKLGRGEPWFEPLRVPAPFAAT